MKKIKSSKKISSLILAVIFIISSAIPSFAAAAKYEMIDPLDYTVRITSVKKAENSYKVKFSVTEPGFVTIDGKTYNTKSTYTLTDPIADIDENNDRFVLAGKDKKYKMHTIATSTPPVNIDETDQEYIVDCEILGLKLHSVPVKNLKVSAIKGGFNATWKMSSSTSMSNPDKLHLEYSLNKNFKKAKTKKKNVSAKKTSVKITRLKKGKSYYVRMRTSKTFGKHTVYSKWVKVGSPVKVK